MDISRDILQFLHYHPLDNEFQIREAMHDTCDLINSRENVFEKAFLIEN